MLLLNNVMSLFCEEKLPWAPAGALANRVRCYSA